MKKITLVLGVMFLMLCLAAMSTLADEKGGAQAGKKQTVQKKATKPAKCWERIPWTAEWINPNSRDPVQGESELPVCKAFEEMLNTTCEPPEKLQCNWTLPEGEKRFKKLEWKPLDWRDYWELITELSVNLISEGMRDERWKLMEDEEREDFEKGKRSLSITTVDIDHDGIKELVVRIDYFPCNENPASLFGIMDPDGKQIVESKQFLFLNVNTNLSPEIMYYDNKTYMFGLDMDDIMIYRGFNPVCKLRYIKGGKKQ